MNAQSKNRVWLACAVALVGCAGFGRATAADEPRDYLRGMKLFRFEFDNDTWLGSDDAFSAGWSIQVHSELRDEWSPGLAGWIGRLPGLHDDGKGGRVVRWAWGVSQLIITPTNITTAAPQPNDAAWAGLLGGYASWSSYDDRRLAAVQLYLGCMGPCSHAETAQKFVHDSLRLGDHPQGWANQLVDKTLVNVNYEYRHKLWARGTRRDPHRWANDLSVGTQVGVGSFATYAEAWLEYRFGWDVPLGFTKFADPPALGVALDPIYVDPNGPRTMQRSWRPYFNLVARARRVDKFAATEASPTQNGGFYQPTISSPGDHQVIAGMHIARLPLAFHLTYYRYLDNVGGVIPSTLDWINFSFERRF